MHDISKGSASPVVYLLTGYFEKDLPVSKLTPLLNRVVVAEDPESASYNVKKPVVLKTNAAGIISTLDNETLATRQPFHAHKSRPIIIPPLESVSLLAVNNPSGWAENFISYLSDYRKVESSGSAQETDKASPPPLPILTLQTVPVSNLKAPITTSKNGAVLSKRDQDYNDWYASEITEKNVKKINAYILAKTRAVILSINSNIPLSSSDNIILSSPVGKDIPATFDPETNLAVISGTNRKLPNGLYRIKIKLDGVKYIAQRPQWCSKSLIREGANYYYELAEMIRFDIKNEAGEFDVINCDPFSVEEAMIKQFPRFYSHLISYAKDLKTEHATYDPKNISVKDENGKEIGRAKVSDEPIKIASGFEIFCHGWAVAKGRAQLAAGLINTDITASASNGNFTTNGKFVLGSKVAKALHDHLRANADTTVQATLDAVFAMQDGQDAWKKLREARAAFTTDAWRQALAENLWRLPANTPAAMESYNKSLGKKLGIPKVAMDAAGNALNIADLTTNIAALGQTTLQQFGTNIPNLAQAKRHYKTVANDYFEHLSAKEIVKDVVIEGTFSLNSEQVTDDYRNTILQQSEAVIKALKQNENLKVTVAGHTCDIGNYDYNIALSERRAEAVKDILVTQAGIDEARIEVLGLGYAQPLINNKDEASRAQNRRVHIAAYAISQINVCPSREGMDSLERFRNLTVANDIKVDETSDDMAWQMINIALGVMAFIPATAPIAAAVAVIKSLDVIATSAANLMDEVLIDNACKHYYAEIQRDKRLGQECAANQGMMHELLSEYNKDGKTQQSTQWAAQFRLRSEAISGLMGLLLRAQREGDKSQYYSNLERYKVKQYIENFLLGDSWALPNLPGASIRMDTFWVFLIDSITNQKQSKNGDKKALYGFSDNYSLLDKAARKAAVTDPENTLYLQSQSNPYGFYMMTVPTVAREHNYITAEFQNYFPIHTFATQEKEGSKYLESFANTFEPVFSEYGEASYHHSAIYYQDQTSKKWLPIIANKLKRLTPFTPIRVLVVFNDTMTGIAPITFEVTRCDGVINNELAYKELVRPLVESELLENEKHFAGKFGCVFTPFFQLGPKTYLGTKPMVHEEAFYSIINDSALEYYQDDNFSDMRYYIGAQVGSSSNVVLPLMGERKDNSDEMIFESDTAEVLYALGLKNKFVANEFYVDLNTKRNGGNEESLLIKDFLTSSSSSFVYPELFAGGKSIRILVRFGGEGKPYLITSKIQRQGQVVRLFKSEFAAAQSLGFKVRQFGDDIIFDDFDWNTQVDIMVVATCTELESDNYTKKLIGLDWRSVPCDLILQQTIGINDIGPKYQSKLCYLGKATRNANKGYKTERILNKMVDTWHDDDYQFEDKWYDNQCQIDEQVGPEYEELIELLNNAGPYNEKGKQGRALLNWHNKDAKAFAGEEQVFVFAANFSLKYDSPKRVKVNGLRPFGDIFTSQFGDIFTDKEDRQYTMELGIASFNSAGNSGFNFNDIGSMTDKISNHGLQLKLPLPNPTNSNLPWGKTLPEADLEELAAELNSDHSTPSQKDLYKRLSEEGLTEDEVKQWFVEDATKRKVRPLGAFKSE
ncbi:OmpA family protein [Pseudoalteromonas sp. Z1A6]|uniref:OmpA family protein n=1 Tax=Pseudoalteromonas sp. Z1A6 TaxID=2686349 RepID=UPI0013FD9DFC|nr:OmpA family protein [Pseudoalteromonas sp. Z1A6]